MSTHVIRQRLTAVLASILMLGLIGAAFAPVAVAQEVDALSGAPVDIHSGTCEEPVLEPTFDAGSLGPDTLTGIEGDEFSTVGLLQDEAQNALGVDLNRDGTLSEDEVVGGIGEDVPVAWADNQFDEAVNTEDQQVVIVHVDPDAGYSTFVACGDLTGAEPDDEGRLIVPLQAQGDYTAFGYSVLEENGETLHTYMFQGGAAPDATPEPAAQAPGGPYPVDIHEGTCSDWVTEPIYDLGDFEVTNEAAEGEQGVGDIEAELPPEAADLGPTYKEGGAGEFDGQTLLDEGPYVVAVHQSAEEYETLIACGAVLPILEDERMIVPLQPVGENELTGVMLMTTGGGEYTGYLWQCTPLEAVTEATPTPAPTEEPTPTPEPTPTEEPTPTPEPSVVVEVTEVITETEVVSPEEATQIAATEEAGD